MSPPHPRPHSGAHFGLHISLAQHLVRVHGLHLWPTRSEKRVSPRREQGQRRTLPSTGRRRTWNLCLAYSSRSENWPWPLTSLLTVLFSVTGVVWGASGVQGSLLVVYRFFSFSFLFLRVRLTLDAARRARLDDARVWLDDILLGACGLDFEDEVAVRCVLELQLCLNGRLCLW